MTESVGRHFLILYIVLCYFLLFGLIDFSLTLPLKKELSSKIVAIFFPHHLGSFFFKNLDNDLSISLKILKIPWAFENPIPSHRDGTRDRTYPGLGADGVRGRLCLGQMGFRPNEVRGRWGYGQMGLGADGVQCETKGKTYFMIYDNFQKSS